MIQLSKYTMDVEWFSPKTLDAIRKRSLNPKIFLDQRILDFVDQLREYFGKPLLLNHEDYSLRGFRTFEENKTIQGSAEYSQHCYGRAADITIIGIPDAIVAEHAKSIGVPYVLLENGWVHMDVRNLS
jgi:uncharacterized protein YcbK (DUF882 family)